MEIYLCVSFFVVGCHGFLESVDTNTVNSTVGDIVGFVRTFTVDSKVYTTKEFHGIPYAEAPVGDRRFAKPMPKARFTTPFAATKDGPICYQLDVFQPTPPGLRMSEDCLFLNIYTPDNAVKKVYPVMIFIHGGGFINGYSNLYKGQFLSASRDVIVVTINYRLAQFGFLTTGDSVAPGNYGLWDQQLAIKWVRDNIQDFGGDANKITIIGESAGSSSVVYQTMFPGNKGLFQRAIAESGSMTSSWANSNITYARMNTRIFSKFLGCQQTTTSDLIKCLRSKTAMEISKEMNSAEAVAARLTAWPPVLDNDFVRDKPVNLLNGKSNAKEALDMFDSVDLMIGVNSEEGYLDTKYWFIALNISDIGAISRNDFENELIPDYLDNYYKQFIPDVVKDTTIFEYTEWADPDNNTKRVSKLADLATDLYFSVPTVLTANLHATSANKSTFVYKFSTQPPQHVIPVPAIMDGPEVANHADELLFVFGSVQATFKVPHGSKVEIAQTAIMTMWTNFAKSGDPTLPEDVTFYLNSTWPEYGMAENYLEMTPDMTPQSVKQRLAPEAVYFLNDLIPDLLKSFSVSS